jgi:hypothetical protein
MSRHIQIILLMIAGIGAFLVSSAIYTVSEVEQMIIKGMSPDTVQAPMEITDVGRQ